MKKKSQEKEEREERVDCSSPSIQVSLLSKIEGSKLPALLFVYDLVLVEYNRE